MAGGAKRSSHPTVPERIRSDAERLRQFVMQDLKARRLAASEADTSIQKAEDIVLGAEESGQQPILQVGQEKGVRDIFTENTERYRLRHPFEDQTVSYEEADLSKVHWTTVLHMTPEEQTAIYGHRLKQDEDLHVIKGGLGVFPKQAPLPIIEDQAAFAPDADPYTLAAKENQSVASLQMIKAQGWAGRIGNFGTAIYSPISLDGLNSLTVSAPRGHATYLANRMMAWMSTDEIKNGGGFTKVRMETEHGSQGVAAFVLIGARNGVPLAIRINVREAVRPGLFAPLRIDMEKSLGELEAEMKQFAAEHESSIDAIGKAMDPVTLTLSPKQLFAMRAREALSSFRTQFRQFKKQNEELERKVNRLRAAGPPTAAQQREIDIADGQIERNQERLILYLEIMRAFASLPK